MDGDPNKQNKNSPSLKGTVSHNIFISREFFLTFWLRRAIRSNNAIDRFLLDYGFNFLPYFGTFLYITLFLTKIVTKC